MPQIVPIKRKRFEMFLKFVGCFHKRNKGDHLIWDRKGLKRPVVFTADREIPVFIIRSNLRTLEMSVEQYLEIITKIK